MTAYAQANADADCSDAPHAQAKETVLPDTLTLQEMEGLVAQIQALKMQMQSELDAAPVEG